MKPIGLVGESGQLNWKTLRIHYFLLHSLSLLNILCIHPNNAQLPRQQPQLASSTGGVRTQRHPAAAIATAVPGHSQQRPMGISFAPISKKASPEEQFITAPQCKCKDIEECSHELDEKSNKCKVMPKCENILKKIGNAAKIRACLDKEQKEMERLEACVEKRVGLIGCTNEENPKNLTISLPSVMMGGSDQKGSRQKRQAGNKTPSLPSNDECTMDQLNSDSKSCASGGPLNCAIKLRCALSPPDDRSQTAFSECEKELNFLPESRFKNSCECLKGAGIKIQCPK